MAVSRDGIQSASLRHVSGWRRTLKEKPQLATLIRIVNMTLLLRLTRVFKVENVLRIENTVDETEDKHVH